MQFPIQPLDNYKYVFLPWVSPIDPAVQETPDQSLGWEGPLENGMATTPVFLPGESHGQRSLAGYSPLGHKELDMTE